MSLPSFFEPKKSLKLFGFKKDFDFLKTLYSKKKFPKVLMLTGIKGIGKSTLINHFLFSINDEKNYDLNNFLIFDKSNLYKQILNNIALNIIYLNGADFKSIKVEDIRNLKKKIYQSNIHGDNRFIILDDVELFNLNSLNALLKIIEEPNKKNFFILINNKTRPLIETITSRSIELKIMLTDNQRLENIDNLLMYHNIEKIIDTRYSQISPGNFIKYNHVFKEFKIDLINNFIDNLTLLLNLYKKNKDNLFIDIVFFITNLHLKKLQNEKKFQNDKIYEIKNFIFNNLNNFLLYNINQNSLINAIDNKLNHE